MPRQWSNRVLRAFVALWFVLSVGEPPIVQVCPMHGGLLGDLRGVSEMAGMSGMAGMHGSRSHSASHHCTCIDCCVGASAAAALPTVAVVLVPVPRTRPTALIVATAEILPRPAPLRAQPPGTGPPRA